MLYFIFINSLTIYTGSYPYTSDFLKVSGIAFTIIFVVFIIISFFVNSYKFVVENNSSKEYFIVVIFIRILFVDFVFYFVIKDAVRQALIEAKVNESEISTQVRANNLFNQIQSIQYEITADTTSNEVKLKAKEIYDTSFDV